MLEQILCINPKLGRKLVKILNLKFPLREQKYIALYQAAKANNEDITKLPANTGFVRDIQLGNLVLLQELDYVCKQHGLKYWLDGGTMLGAVRHKGFIPWDDDIDTGMLRPEYEQLYEVFNKTSRNKDIFLDFIRSRHNPCMYWYKVQHRKLPFLFVDIFPYELFHSKLSEAGKREMSRKAVEIRRNLSKDKSLYKLNNQELYKYIKLTVEEQVRENKPVHLQEKPDVFWGMDFAHIWNNWFYNYEDFFPLKEFEFEGFKFPGLANPDAYLSGLYGNYMDYPSTLELAHCKRVIISKSEKKELAKLIGKV